MCWSETASLAMVGLGAAATVVTIRAGKTPAIPATLAYFAVMEALQVAGYGVIDQCAAPANQAVTLLSVLHIVFQPFAINAFAMALVVGGVRPAMRASVFTLCAISSTVMLLQLYPFEWAGACRPGDILCSLALCTRAGVWHLAWDVPYNALLVPLEAALGTHFGFPTYMAVVFLLPIAYGAWRFALFHALAGPMLASRFTDQPNEVPAIWCLFSVGLVLIALSPWLWRRFAVHPEPT
jgi:hypothetical protein